MIILDSDHMSVLRYAVDRRYGLLAGRMLASADQDFATTAITLEESLRGWLAQIRRSKSPDQEIVAYDKLVAATRFLSGCQIMPYSRSAADHFTDLRQQKIRIGTMDLKIAAIALAESATLLSANVSDFQQVPGFRSKTGCGDCQLRHGETSTSPADRGPSAARRRASVRSVDR